MTIFRYFSRKHYLLSFRNIGRKNKWIYFGALSDVMVFSSWSDPFGFFTSGRKIAALFLGSAYSFQLWWFPSCSTSFYLSVSCLTHIFGPFSNPENVSKLQLESVSKSLRCVASIVANAFHFLSTPVYLHGNKSLKPCLNWSSTPSTFLVIKSYLTNP